MVFLAHGVQAVIWMRTQVKRYFFTFQPTDPALSAFQITLEVDDLDRLQDFAIQSDPTPVFCNVSSTRYDLIDIFQMNLDLS